MLAINVAVGCRSPVASLAAGVARQTLSRPVNKTGLYSRVQLYASKNRRQTFKEKMMAPASGSAFTMGQVFVAGGAALGIGALCFYGLGISNEKGALERSVEWSTMVRQRIRDTYLYLGGNIVVAAGAAVAAARSPMITNFMNKNYMNLLLYIGATFAAEIGTGMVCKSIPYEPGVGAKQAAWLVHAGVKGASIGPPIMRSGPPIWGGPWLVRAACYTAGMGVGLSAVAACAPSEKFLNMGGVLGAGLGVVFVASLGSAFLPPTTRIGSGLYWYAMYGVVVLMSLGFLLDTQQVIKKAETHPVNAERRFDPTINTLFF